jgi:hypothetical protein
MRVRSLAIAIAIVAALAVAGATGAQEKEVTLTGEIVDLQCYLTKHGGEGRGADHAGCANACIGRGVAAGFLAKDGTLYVLFDAKMISPKDAIAGLAGKRVTITAAPLERDGVKALRLLRVDDQSGG